MFRRKKWVLYGLILWLSCATTSFAKTLYVKVDVANVRSGPSTKYPIIATVAKATQLLILDYRKGWCKVRLPDETTGWINRNLLTKQMVIPSSRRTSNQGAISFTKKRPGAGVTPPGRISISGRGRIKAVSTSGHRKIRISRGKTARIAKPSPKRIPKSAKGKIILGKPGKIQAPQKKFNMAILDLGAQNVSQMDAAVVKNFIQEEIVNTRAVVVLERANMDRILAEQKFQMTGCTTRECAIEIGKILNVEKVVIGNFSKALGIYYISAQIVDVESGEIEVAESIEVSSPRDLRPSAQQLARELIRKLPGKHP